MSWLRKLSAIVLLAVWLPVTSHCALEMAGVISAMDCCAEGDDHCDRDNCEEVESNLFKPAAETSLVKAPGVSCACIISYAAVMVVPVASLPGEGVPIDWTSDWLAEWSFEHRTAPPARAPSAIV